MRKKNGNLKSWQEVNCSRVTLSQCHLMDLGYIGNRFTWSNGRGGAANNQERLDRALATGCWRSLFPTIQVRHLSKYRSDHNPVVIEEVDNGIDWNKRRKKK